MDIGACRRVIGMTCTEQYNTPCFTYFKYNLNVICLNDIKINAVFKQAVPMILNLISNGFNLCK